MGLEIKASGGRVVYVRETHRVVDPLDMPGPPCDPDPTPWGCLIVILIVIAFWLLPT